MPLLGRKHRPYGSSSKLLHLTDARSAVVSRKPTRNLVWGLISLPSRIVMALWNWVMESKPSGYPRYKSR
jgi:hypothetical protein